MQKKLNYTEVFSILLGAIIGWGSFMLPGSKFLHSSGVINTSIGLFLGTMSIIIIEQNYRHMLNQDINEGGEFSYVLLFLGRKHSFIVGWFLFLAYLSLVPLNAMALPLVIDKMFPDVLKFGYMYTIAGNRIYIGQVIVSVCVIIIFAVINYFGIKQTGFVQQIIVTLLIISTIIVLVGMLTTSDYNAFYNNYISDYKFSIKQVSVIFAITPFLFIGFDAIPQLIKDMDISRRTASRMAVSSLVIGMLIYITLNFITGLAFSPDKALSLDWALGSGVLSQMGKVGFSILVIALASAVTGGINGFMVCSTKLIGAMGREKVLPYNLCKTNKYGSVKNAIFFVSAVGIIACFFGREVILWIVDMCSFGAAITYLYVCITTRKIAGETKLKVTSSLGIIFSLMYTVLLLWPGSPAHLTMPSVIFLVIWCILGLILWIRLYFFDKKGNFQKNNFDNK